MRKRSPTCALGELRSIFCLMDRFTLRIAWLAERAVERFVDIVDGMQGFLSSSVNVLGWRASAYNASSAPWIAGREKAPADSARTNHYP